MQIQSNTQINAVRKDKKDKLHYVEFNDLGYKITIVNKLHEVEILSCTEVLWNQESDIEKTAILTKQLQEQRGGYLIIKNSCFTTLPIPFFSEDLLKDYLFIHKGKWDMQKSIPYCDSWQKENLFLTYAMPNFVLNILRNTSNTQVYHQTTSLNYIIRKKKLVKGKTIFLYGAKDKFMLLAMDNEHFFFAEEYPYTENTDVIYKILSLRKFLQWDDLSINCFILFFDKINKQFADLLLSYKFNLVAPNPEHIAQKFGLSFKQKPELNNHFLLLFLATCEL